MRKEATAFLIITMITVNLCFIWFNAMGVFEYQPSGVETEYNVEKYGFTNLVTDGFLITGLALVGILISRIMKINAFAMIMFTEIFWFPWYKTSAIFHEVFQYAPEVFWGVEGIFSSIMLFTFAFALIELSQYLGGS
jgi:mannose/fructose/N-acetylgalactosamine-specific phosphotransferase system component IID